MNILNRHKKTKIAFLVPTTSNKREWEKVEDSYFYNIFLKTLKKTLIDKFNYTIYLGIDKNDKLFENNKNIRKIINSTKEIKIKPIIISDISKGHVTEIWNRLFKIAYNEKNDYFYQCGDDINFNNIKNDWLVRCINNLLSIDNIGISSPKCFPNKAVLTQTLVSRKHMEIFGCYFPKQIKNWYCDDWINQVYESKYIKALNINYIIKNEGGDPRYNYEKDEPKNLKKYCDIGRKMINNYIKKNGLEEKHRNIGRGIRNKMSLYMSS